MADPVFVDDVTPLNAVNMNKLQTRDEKAAANGYPSLDASGKVPTAQLPAMNQTLGELAYGEFTAPVTCAGVAEAGSTPIVTAPAVTLDGATPVVVDVFIPALYFTDQPDAFLHLFDGSTSLGQYWFMQGARVVPSSYMGVVPRISTRLTPGAGAHTFSLRGRVSSGAGMQVIAGAGGSGNWGPGFIRVSLAAPISNAPAGALMPVQYGTSLPTSPVDGQEAILVDSLTNPTYQWRFRYNAGSSSTYKWEFVGGSFAVAAPVNGAENTASSYPVWTDLATVGPQIVVPRAGEYLAEVKAHATNDTPGGSSMLNARSTLAAEPDAGLTYAGGDAASSVQALYTFVELPCNAGDTIKARYCAIGGGLSTFVRREMKVIPRRVA